MSQELSPPDEFIAAMLRVPLDVVEIERKQHASGTVIRDEVLMTNRLILVVKGALNYQVERKKKRMTAGKQLLVPNWVRRTWRTSQGCEIYYVDFAVKHLDASPLTLFWRDANNIPLECCAMDRMRDALIQSQADDGSRRLLELEGELKGMLGRFWPTANALHEAVFANTQFADALHPEVRRAVKWLSEHFARPDAIAEFYETLRLSPDYFRRQFAEAYRESMQTRLNRIRLRHARFLLHESSLSVKEIAGECGFNDPLFFSRQYRKFWGVSPSQHRAGAKG
ncbi:AraC family transcriptional regulator [Cerasicoccus maritimus]|uniref:AraC family transcriptional regulator n=1 Tax=Cerasicoccus maritimus TaxID=490089 RepID=UPI0028526E1A|nr:AraC family transcriptional regulator [Cerasicoccus maritimus]